MHGHEGFQKHGREHERRRPEDVDELHFPRELLLQD